MYKKVMMERSTHGIPEREGYSLKWSIGRVFVQNVPAMATGCSVEGSSGTGMLNVVYCPVGIPGSSPLKDMMSITKVVPREFSPFVQKKKRLSVQRAFHLY